MGSITLIVLHFWSDSWVHMMMNVPNIMRKLKKNRGLMPLALTPPKMVTNQAPSIGPAIPNRPAATVSQIIIPVARSSLARQFPQTVEQLWMLTEKPSQ